MPDVINFKLNIASSVAVSNDGKSAAVALGNLELRSHNKIMLD